ncbi:MAG: tetratricopeptide repeat protein [Enterobacterales bacterium]|nr:tetratricopeptide repeat protein [Enterobacterales bacterium]
MIRIHSLSLVLILAISQNTLATTTDNQAIDKMLSKAEGSVNKKVKTYNLVVPRNFKHIELRIKQKHYWKPVNFLMNHNKASLTAGNYRFQIELQSSIAKFKGEFTISDPAVVHSIYATASPNRKYIYVWHSTAKKNTPAYKQEKSLRICLSPINTPSVYQDAEFPQFAFDACKLLADKKQPEAIAQMGHFYRKGIHVKEDLVKAKSLLRKAFKLGHDNAGAELFAISAEQGKLPPDVISILKILSDHDLYFASASLSISYLQGRDVKRNIKEAKRYALKAVDQGSATAFSLVANIIMQEDKYNPDSIEALAWIYARMRSFYELNFRIKQFAELLEDELTDLEIAQARKRSNEILKNLQGQYQANITIGNIFDNPEYKNKTISVKINNDEKLTELIQGKINHLKYLFSGFHKQRIEFYLDGEMEFF